MLLGHIGPCLKLALEKLKDILSKASVFHRSTACIVMYITYQEVQYKCLKFINVVDEFSTCLLCAAFLQSAASVHWLYSNIFLHPSNVIG